ncbi:hypothetical protein PCK2_000644, partial [Pneumocystis canis]
MEAYERGFSQGSRKRYRGNYDWGPENHKRLQHATEEIVLSRLRKHILSLGEPILNENIESVAQILIIDFTDETLHNGILSTFRDYVIELPMKIPFLATVVSLASTKEASIGKCTIEYMANAAQAFIDSGEWRKFKLVLRFLVYATSMIDGDGIMHVLNGLTQRIFEIYMKISGGEFSHNSYADELTYIFLITVPYVIARSMENTSIIETLFSYMERIEPYMKYRSIDISLLQPFVEAEPPDDLEVLEHLWNQAQYIKNDNCSMNIFARPWTKFEIQLANTPKFALPPIVIPETFRDAGKCYFPGPFFRIFVNQSIETVPSSKIIASSIIKDVVGDIIDIMEFNRKKAARFLADLSYYFAPNLFVSQTSSDEINNKTNTLTEWKSDDIVLETIFGRLFQLPKPSQRSIYYHSLLIELCKLIPKRFAPSLGYAIRYIYQALPRLNAEISFRFWSWFSHHL